jgi:hypothetical protein
MSQPLCIIKKRGRKTKKSIESCETCKDNIIYPIEENIIVNIEEHKNTYNENNFIDNNYENDNDNNYENDNDNNDNNNEDNNDNIKNDIIDDKPVIKKRGRKPKGGKIIQQINPLSNNKEIKPNIILHLKCSLKDIYSNDFSSNVEGYSFLNNNINLSYNIINKNENNNINNDNNEFINQSSKLIENDCDFDNECEDDKDNDIRNIWKKLKILEHCLHINSNCNKKSACFWDTCEFDNPIIYIPKYFMNNSYHVYGCFCSPECAVAYLMNEPIDSSTKFERYYLLNSIYGKIYDYNKNIKPSPNPYYILEKYYGNLNIQEYRSLLRNERLFLVVDKPLTKIMPELHEDNDDFIINNKIIPSNTYQIKKRLLKKQTKTNILSERFGLVN